jgi:aminoglycoside 6'-N-acetyltransferase I
MVSIEPCRSLDQSGWLLVRRALWPHASESEHLAEMACFLGQPEKFAQFIAYDYAHRVTGFVEASIRNDYVNGTASSPVAFLEGIYVVAERRRLGIARALTNAVSQWAISRGVRELASDAALENELSHDVHRALGFTETERVVYFRKELTFG